MNAQRQSSIKQFCDFTWGEASITHFGSIRRYTRFCRRFFNQHKFYPSPLDFPKRHGKNERKMRAR